MTETKMRKEVKASRKGAKSLTLDEIEDKMIKLAATETNDVLTLMMNEKKIAMLEKVANFKLHRLQLKALEQQPQEVDVKPIEVKFINSKTEEQKARLERIENEIKESRHVRQDA